MHHSHARCHTLEQIVTPSEALINGPRMKVCVLPGSTSRRTVVAIKDPSADAELTTLSITRRPSSVLGPTHARVLSVFARMGSCTQR